MALLFYDLFSFFQLFVILDIFIQLLAVWASLLSTYLYFYTGKSYIFVAALLGFFEYFSSALLDKVATKPHVGI